MEQISFLERIGKIFGLITSSAFFISLFVIVILTVALVIINSKVKIKLPKLFAGIGYLIVIVFIIVKYGMALYNMQDTFTDKVFSSFYFPNLITYISIVLISIFVMVLNILNREKTLVFRTIGIISFGIIIMLFIISLDTVIKNEIDIYSAKSIYENTDLMVTIQTSTAIFFIWMIIELIDYFSKKLAIKVDSKPKSNGNKNNTSNQNAKTISEYNNNIKNNYMNNYYNNQKNNYNTIGSNNSNYSNYYGTYNNSNYSNQNNYQNVKSEYQNINKDANDNTYKRVNYLSDVNDDYYNN